MGDKFLVGKTITDIKIAEDKKALLFLCEDGEFIARAEGDCCSDTWIEDVNTPPLGFPAFVLDAVDRNLSQSDLDDDNYLLQVYGLSIKTDRGDIEIEYRNESNGYYGGDLVWPDERHYGGVYGQNVSNEVWRDIKEQNETTPSKQE